MRKLLLSLGVAALVLAPVACDFEKTGNQIRAEKMMVAAILATPPIDFDPTAFVEFDGGFDGGTFPGADAGFSLDGGVVTVPPQTVSFVFFGERENQSLDSPPMPIEGATVTVGATGQPAATLQDKGEGKYELTSFEDESLTYASGETYAFTAQHEGESFVGTVADAPALERIEAFHPPKGFIDHPADASFTFTRPPAMGGTERNLGFVTVFPVGEDGERGEPTYTNIPSTPLEFLKLAALPSKWKEGTVTVPGTAFPEPEQTYVLVLQAVKMGSAESENLFTGSAILAGTAEVGIFRTR